jgi:hypothetical protein
MAFDRAHDWFKVGRNDPLPPAGEKLQHHSIYTSDIDQHVPTFII